MPLRAEGQGGTRHTVLCVQKNTNVLHCLHVCMWCRSVVSYSRKVRGSIPNVRNVPLGTMMPHIYLLVNRNSTTGTTFFNEGGRW